MSYKGDRLLGSSLSFKFTSVNGNGAPTTLGSAPIVSVYIDGSLVQSVTGVTLTTDFDAVTGLNHVAVAATSGNGFATGHDYDLILTNGAAGGVSYVGYTIGSFSIGMCTQAIANAVWDENIATHLASGQIANYLLLIDTYGQFLSTATGSHGEGLTALPSNTAFANALADALLDRASGIETSMTLRQALRLILSSSAAKSSGAATSTFTIRDINDTKDRLTVTTDADGNRTAVVPNVA